MTGRKNTMDKKQAEAFRKVLTKMKDDLVHDIKNMSDNGNQKEDSRDVAGHALHMADVATDMYDREFNLGLASTERELLYKIENALKRIDEHTFGLCSECNAPILIARLKAIPYAELCVDCQEKHEKKR